MFFLRQNYRLTIIHSQTLQISCNLFKLSQESCYLYSIYILYRLPIFLNFSHIIQAIISIYVHNYFQTTSKTVHYHNNIPTQVSLLSSTTFFSMYFLSKTKNDTLNFYAQSITLILNIIYLFIVFSIVTINNIA